MDAAKCGTFDLTEEYDKDAAECAVCLQPYVYPAQLPCGHIFCFLCIKGTANQSKRCAMCRQEIPRDFIERPNLLKNKEVELCETTDGGSYQWFYEGRNGWWQYDERTSKELEVAYNSGERTCELLIAGFLYVMDFDAMLQLRRTDPSRRRRMKRDLLTIDKKGIAGLRIEHNEDNAVTQPIPQNMRSRGFSREGGTSKSLRSISIKLNRAAGSQHEITQNNSSQTSGSSNTPTRSNQPFPTRRPDAITGDSLQLDRHSPILVESSSDEELVVDVDEGEQVDADLLFTGEALQNININDV